MTKKISSKILFFISILLFSSCMTLNKAKQKMRDNPVALAEMCALHFPTTDKFIKGDPVIQTKEVVRVDTVTVEVDGKAIKVACPECRSKTETITVTDTIIRLDEASLFVLLSQVNDLTIKGAVSESKISDLKKEKKRLIIWICSLSVILLLSGFFAVKRLL